MYFKHYIIDNCLYYNYNSYKKVIVRETLLHCGPKRIERLKIHLVTSIK